MWGPSEVSVKEVTSMRSEGWVSVRWAENKLGERVSKGGNRNVKG